MGREFFFESEDKYQGDVKIFNDSGVLEIFKKYICYDVVTNARIEFNESSKDEPRASIKLIFNESEDESLYNFCRLYVNPKSKKIEGEFKEEIFNIDMYVMKKIVKPDVCFYLRIIDNSRGKYPY